MGQFSIFEKLFLFSSWQGHIPLPDGSIIRICFCIKLTLEIYHYGTFQLSIKENQKEASYFFNVAARFSAKNPSHALEAGRENTIHVQRTKPFS